jgi:hypothetical protein
MPGQQPRTPGGYLRRLLEEGADDGQQVNRPSKSTISVEGTTSSPAPRPAGHPPVIEGDHHNMADAAHGQRPPVHDRSPWWVAAAGGGGGITAAVLQYHGIAWAITAAFTAWLIHNVAIAWLQKEIGPVTADNRTTRGSRLCSKRALQVVQPVS